MPLPLRSSKTKSPKVVTALMLTSASSSSSTSLSKGSLAVTLAMLTKSLTTPSTVQVYSSDACGASSANVRSQAGAIGSLTTISVSVTSPVLVTLIVKVTSSSASTSCVSGDFSISILGRTILTSASSSSSTGSPSSGSAVTLAMLTKSFTTPVTVQVYSSLACGASVANSRSQFGATSSVTLIFVSGRSPVFVTLIVKVTSLSASTSCKSGDFSISMPAVPAK